MMSQKKECIHNIFLSSLDIYTIIHCISVLQISILFGFNLGKKINLTFLKMKSKLIWWNYYHLDRDLYSLQGLPLDQTRLVGFLIIGSGYPWFYRNYKKPLLHVHLILLPFENNYLILNTHMNLENDYKSFNIKKI